MLTGHDGVRRRYIAGARLLVCRDDDRWIYPGRARPLTGKSQLRGTAALGPIGDERDRAIPLTVNFRDRRLAFSPQLSLQRFLPRILDCQQHTIGISGCLVSGEYAFELAIGSQLTVLELRPHLARKLGFHELRREAAESAANVVHVTLEHRERPVIAGRIYGLGQIDNDGSFGADEHVELRQIAVDESDA